MDAVSFIGLERDAVPPAFAGAGVLQRSLHTLPGVYLVPRDQPALLVDVARWQEPADAVIGKLGRHARTVMAMRSLLGGYASAIYRQAMRAVEGDAAAEAWCDQWFYAWPTISARVAEGPDGADMRPAGMVIADAVRSLQQEWGETARQIERRVAAERLAAAYPGAEPTEMGDIKLGFDHGEHGRVIVYAAAPKFGPTTRVEAVRPVRDALRLALLAHAIAKANGITRHSGSEHVVRDVLLNPDVSAETREFLRATRAGEYPGIPGSCLGIVEMVDTQSFNMADRACKFVD